MYQRNGLLWALKFSFIDMIKKLGSVPFLNSKPLTYLFDKGKYTNYKTEFLFPSDLLESLINGRTFLSLISIADHFSNNKIKSLDKYCISAIGKVDSVILVASSDIKKLEKVYLDPRSKSANILFKIIQEDFVKNKVEYDFLRPKITNSYESNTGQIIIGDLALKYVSQKPSGLKIYDLSEIWYKETSLPFTFATFNYYRDVPNSEEMKLLDDSFNEGIGQIDNIIKVFLDRYKSKVDSKLVERYLKERIVYKLTNNHLEGINLFNKLSSKFAKWEKRSFNNIF